MLLNVILNLLSSDYLILNLITFANLIYQFLSKTKSNGKLGIIDNNQLGFKTYSSLSSFTRNIDNQTHLVYLFLILIDNLCLIILNL